MAYFIPNPRGFSVKPYMGSSAFVEGLEMNIISLTEFTINPGAARDLLSSTILSYNPLQNGGNPVITVDVTRLGANGCYPYLPAQLNKTSNTVYPVYIVSNTSGTTDGSTSSSINPAIIVATGDEFLPPSMNAYRRIGWLYMHSGTDGTIYKWAQSGSGNQRTYTLASQRQRVHGANPTVYTPISMTSVNGVVPPKPNVTALLNVFLSSAVEGEGAFFSYTDSETGRFGPIYVLNPVVGQNLGVPFQMVCGQDPATNDAIIYYKVTDPGNMLWIDSCGFVDELSNTLY